MQQEFLNIVKRKEERWITDDDENVLHMVILLEQAKVR